MLVIKDIDFIHLQNPCLRKTNGYVHKMIWSYVMGKNSIGCNNALI